MVASGRVDEEDFRRLHEGSDGGLQQHPLTESEQARLVGGTGAARDHDRLVADTGCCPSGISGPSRAAAAAVEADEDRADPRGRLEAPRRGVERGQAHLLLDQLLAGARPLPHALILAVWTRSLKRRATPASGTSGC